MTTRAGLRARLDKIRRAIEPKGSRIHLSDPLEGGDDGVPLIQVKNNHGVAYWTSPHMRAMTEAAAKHVTAEEAERAKRFAAMSGEEIAEAARAEAQVVANPYWAR
jgi:hypothetical protein